MEKKIGKSLCIFSSKGGVGKTITTLNLAGVFEVMGKRVLIVDLDLSGGQIALSLNKPYEKTIYNFAMDYMNNRYHSFLDYVTKYDEHIDFLACPKDPRQANKIASKYIEIMLDKAVYYYDVVLIDTHHVLNETNLVLLDKTDSILFVMNNDPFDVKNMKSLMAIFKDLNKTNYKILLNDSRDPMKKYFSLYDITSILKSEINYFISSEFYVKNIDQYIMNGQIITLHPKASSIFNKDFAVLTKVATDFVKEGEES